MIGRNRSAAFEIAGVAIGGTLAIAAAIGGSWQAAAVGLTLVVIALVRQAVRIG